MKRCCHCKKTKPFGEFHKLRASADGHKPDCKECRNSANRERYNVVGGHARNRYERQRDYMRMRKRAPCEDCGQSYPAPVMHFHHVQGPKLFNVGSALGKSLAVIEAEIAKCVVLCANCHILRHLDEEGNKINEAKESINA